MDLLGLRFTALTRTMARDRVRAAVREGRPMAISAVNAPKIVRLPHDPDLARALRAADLLLPDGASVVWASRVLGTPLPERITGADFLDDLLEDASDQSWRVYLLGTTERTSVRAADEVRRRWPGLVLVGRQHGWFDDRAAVEAEVSAARPDVLVLALETPRKEILAVDWRDRLGIPVVIGVGGALDVIAGERRRAPRLVQHAGLEWAWRTAGRPVRTWTGALGVNLAFARLVARERRDPGALARALNGSDPSTAPR